MRSRRLREVVHRKTRRHDLVFRICIVEIQRTNNIIYKLKSLKCLVSERSLLTPLLYFVVALRRPHLLATGHKEDCSLGSNEASITSRRRERKNANSEPQKKRIPNYISSKVLFEDPWIPISARLQLSRASLQTLVVPRNVLPTQRAFVLPMSFRCRSFQRRTIYDVRQNETTLYVRTRGSGNLERKRIAWMLARKDIYQGE
jgi:hypothetical protein